MSQISDFYEIKSIDISEEGIKGVVSLNETHPIFSAHFPGNPITPGVLLLRIVTELLEKSIDKRMQLNTAVNIKFKKPIHPSIEPTFMIRKMKEIGNQISVNISIEAEDIQYVKMSLLYDLKSE